MFTLRNFVIFTFGSRTDFLMTESPSIDRALMETKSHASWTRLICFDERKELYETVVDNLIEMCGFFSLVWRSRKFCSDKGWNCHTTIAEELVHEELVNEWPGTRVDGDQATIRIFRATISTREFLETPNHLFAWLRPDFPEDLALYDANRQLWMFSVTHERTAWWHKSRTPEWIQRLAQNR